MLPTKRAVLRNDFLWESSMKHPFHIVDIRPWPLTSSFGGLFFVSGLTSYFHRFDNYLWKLGALLLIITSFLWFRDICREATMRGLHSRKVVSGLRLGILLFIVSEVFLFFSFFWAFFHSSLSPVLGWPLVETMNPLGIPLLNTILLLSRGCTITWAHISILNSFYREAWLGLGFTVFLGFLFTFLQVFEYFACPFTMSDSIYGSVFFITTGFHGAHVVLGSIFIVVRWLRLCHITYLHHFGFEARAWYWHFVDVIWLFLYIRMYWWGK